MSRRKAAPRRKILPDPKYHNEQLAKFINHLMVNGKKSIAESIVYQALDWLTKNGHKDALASFGDVIEKLKPLVEVKSRRVGGATYPVPVEVRTVRQQTLAMRWLIEAARKRGEKTMAHRLGAEINDAVNDRGAAMKRREDVHRMAESNRAFSHYRY